MLQPLPAEQIQPTIQNLLAFLDSDAISVPGNMLESITSAKSLCRALLGGQIVIAAAAQLPQGEPPTPMVAKEEAEKAPAPKKKARARKKTAK